MAGSLSCCIIEAHRAWRDGASHRAGMLTCSSNKAISRERGAMAQYKLHCFSQSGNSYKVALYLNCSGLDWEPAFVDFFNGATRDAKWRASVNEMGEAPVLETRGKKLTQSGAILLYLAEMT